ncbi:hypothetical protein JTB14_030690 [Gonioctena quinquepunctata]|nr:hypothetical protein JTB14_030690 [Gonioctena quinquepunctata]
MSGSPIPEDSIRPSDNDILAYQESTTNMYLLPLLSTNGSNQSLGYGGVNVSYPQEREINSFYFYKICQMDFFKRDVQKRLQMVCIQ